MSLQIRICTEEDIGILAKTIRKSFQDVAVRFGLTKDNAPRHPSNCTEEWVQKDMARGVTYFVIEDGGQAAGCVALEQASPEVCYLKRLAVLPDRRRRGFGKALVKHVLSEAGLVGAGNVGIGMIAEQTELKDWYKGIGFVEVESKEYPHLPFRVTFMKHDLKEAV